MRNYQEVLKATVGWKILDVSYVPPSDYGSPDIICHKNASPANISVEVEAGGQIELQWSEWPESHRGPVLDYLANCNGPCNSVEKGSLKFTKIGAVGLIRNNTDFFKPGYHASDQLREDGNRWTVTIPKEIADGEYVLRHEIISLHDGAHYNGSQNYPQCINIKVSGSGTDSLESGTPGESLYKLDEAGILVNIYQNLNYIIPGPPMYNGSTANPSPPLVLSSKSSTTQASDGIVTSTASPSADQYPTSILNIPSGRGDTDSTTSSTSALASATATSSNRFASSTAGSRAVETPKSVQPVPTTASKPSASQKAGHGPVSTPKALTSEKTDSKPTASQLVDSIIEICKKLKQKLEQPRKHSKEMTYA